MTKLPLTKESINVAKSCYRSAEISMRDEVGDEYIHIKRGKILWWCEQVAAAINLEAELTMLKESGVILATEKGLTVTGKIISDLEQRNLDLLRRVKVLREWSSELLIFLDVDSEQLPENEYKIWEEGFDKTEAGLRKALATADDFSELEG